MAPLRSILADNPGPFTLEGTRTFILGRRNVAVLDPGPDLQPHLQALAAAVVDAEEVTVVLTHGHGDHAGGVDGLRELLAAAGRRDVPVRGAGHPAATPLGEGEAVETDAGILVTMATPGHTRDHLAFHWPEGDALFAGDIVLGAGETTWVGEYPGCVADYLATLDRLERLSVGTVHPTHGPDIHDVPGVWRRFRAHREERIRQVRALVGGGRGWREDEILEAVYGDAVPAGLAGAALASLRALMEYVGKHPGS